MRSINRRQLIAGAVALLSQPHLPLAFAAEHQSELNAGKPYSLSGPPKPENFLSSTFTPALLSKSLASAPAWHPYPKVDEREAWQGIPKDIGDAIVRRAEAVLGTEWASLPATIFLEFKRTGNRSHYEDRYSTRRQRLADLTLAECMEGKGRFLDEIANGVWLICEETFWGVPAHLALQKAGPGLPESTEPVVDLFAAETAANLSLVHYLVGSSLDQVSPLITHRIQREAKRRILDPAFERDDFWWMWKGTETTGHRLNNWNPWINSNLIVTNLLLEQDPARRISALSKICKSLDQYLSDYSPDGGCEEGPGYWGASAACYFDCCNVLTSATGGAVNVLANPFIGKMEHYIADIHIANDYYVNYGDAGVKEGPSPELAYRIGSGVGDKVLQAFGAFYMPSIVAVSSGEEDSLVRVMPNILSAAKVRSAQKADALERDSWYPALGLMTTRTKAGTSAGFYLAVQAAPNLRSHGHNDSGSFIVFHDGEPVIIDVGVEDYTAKTFSSERYTIWTMQSAYHNLPTVGGVMQSAAKAMYRASDLHYINNDAYAGLSMNLATAFPEEAGIVRWLRNITLDRKADCIRLAEDFQLQQKVPVALSFMTPRVPSQGPNGSVVLRAADKSVRDVSLKYDPSMAGARFEKIVLKDEGLRHTWGENIYRVLLTSSEPTDSGKWMIEIG